MNNKEQKRPEIVSLRLQHLRIPFYNEVEKRNESGVKTSSSSFLRECVRAGLQPESIKSFEELALLRAEVELLRRELAPVGGNLNQLAHLFNMNHPTDVSHVERQHHKLIRVFSSISKQLKSIEKSLW